MFQSKWEKRKRAIVGAITDGLREEHDLRPMRTDGSMQGTWVILDFFDVIVHIMRTDARERYTISKACGATRRELRRRANRLK